MSSSGLLPCKLPPNPISLPANPCCNYTVGVVLSLEEGDATTRFHQRNRWFSGRLAARGACAAAEPDAPHRRADGLSRKRLASTELYRGIPGRTSKARVDGWPRPSDRHSLGGV